MEKRNIIEPGRTPMMEKQGSADDFEKEAVAAFKPCRQSSAVVHRKRCPSCECDADRSKTQEQ